MTFIALYLLPEILGSERRNPEPLRRALSDYGQLLRDRRILGYAGVGGFFYGGMFAYIAGTPFAYISYCKLKPQFYGLLFAAGILGIMFTNQVNACLVKRFGGDRLMCIGSAVAMIAGVLIAIEARTGWGGLAGLVVPLFLFVSMTGFIVANSIAGALSQFRQRAGAVSALLGTFQYGTGVLGSALVALFADATPWPMGWVMLLMGGLCFLSTRLLSTQFADAGDSGAHPHPHPSPRK